MREYLKRYMPAHYPNFNHDPPVIAGAANATRRPASHCVIEEAHLVASFEIVQRLSWYWRIHAALDIWRRRLSARK
jgi:hypothetical protein